MTLCCNNMKNVPPPIASLTSVEKGASINTVTAKPTRRDDDMSDKNL